MSAGMPLSKVSTLVLQQCLQKVSGTSPATALARVGLGDSSSWQESYRCRLSRKGYCTLASANVKDPYVSDPSNCTWRITRLKASEGGVLLPLGGNNNHATCRRYTQAASTLTREQLHDLVYRLNEDEREQLMNTLKQFESNKRKAQFEGQLAATVWRSRFGRPSRLKPALGDVDPTGAYCAVPEDWLQKKFAETSPAPPTRDLMKLALLNSLPFIGFGFLDNFTMIIAGDYIEHTLGLYMCISTMAAAALGNTISDVIGIGSAFYVEKLAEMSGVKPPMLTPVQLEMKSSRRAANLGRVFGITIGCLLGMCPLLFMKEEKDEIQQQATEGTEPKKQDKGKCAK